MYFKQNCLFWVGFPLTRFSLSPFYLQYSWELWFRLPHNTSFLCRPNSLHWSYLNPKINKNVGDRHQRGNLYLNSGLISLKSIINADFLLLIIWMRNGQECFVSLNKHKANFTSINFIKSNTSLKFTNNTSDQFLHINSFVFYFSSRSKILGVYT